MTSILGLVASPRRGGRTDRLVRSALAGAVEAGAAADIAYLGDLRIEFCRGCLSCVYGDGCPRPDDAMWLFEKAASYDGLILGSPVFFGGVPAQLKTVIDRGVSRFPHFRELGKAKAAGTILVQGRQTGGTPYPGGVGEGRARTEVNEVAFLLGGLVVGTMTVQGPAGPAAPGIRPEEEREAWDLGRAVCQARRVAGAPGRCPVCGLPDSERCADGSCPFCLHHPSHPAEGRFTPEALDLHLEEWMLPSRERFIKRLPEVRGATRAMGDHPIRRLRPPRTD